jgi:prevent-host-death family protein
MQVSITQFRRNIFALMSEVLEGHEVWITHKGRRMRVVPEAGPKTRLARITPLEIVASDGPDAATAEPGLRDEMTRAWERDWAML